MGRPPSDGTRRDATPRPSDAGDSGEMGDGDDKWDRHVSERERGLRAGLASELDGLGPMNFPPGDFLPFYPLPHLLSFSALFIWIKFFGHYSS